MGWGRVGQQAMCVSSMIHPGQAQASSDHYSHLKFVLFCEILESGDGRTDTTCKNSDHYWPWMLVGRVDQEKVHLAVPQSRRVVFLSVPTFQNITKQSKHRQKIMNHYWWDWGSGRGIIDDFMSCVCLHLVIKYFFSTYANIKPSSGEWITLSNCQSSVCFALTLDMSFFRCHDFCPLWQKPPLPNLYLTALVFQNEFFNTSILVYLSNNLKKKSYCSKHILIIFYIFKIT